jgi:hypothetical protein
MISQFFVLSPRGDVIIRRDYLGNVPKARGATPLAAARAVAPRRARAPHLSHPGSDANAPANPPVTAARPRPRRPRGRAQRARPFTLPNPPPPFKPQTSTEIFFRNSRFYKGGDEAPPVFIIDGVTYLHVKARVCVLCMCTYVRARTCVCVVCCVCMCV